jgi:hypothetical protein
MLPCGVRHDDLRRGLLIMVRLRAEVVLDYADAGLFELSDDDRGELHCIASAPMLDDVKFLRPFDRAVLSSAPRFSHNSGRIRGEGGTPLGGRHPLSREWASCAGESDLSVSPATRSSLRASIAQASDAHAARIDRFSQTVRSGSLTMSIGCPKARAGCSKSSSSARLPKPIGSR